MSEDNDTDDSVDLLKNMQIIQEDGTTRQMSDEEAQDFATVLSEISVRANEEAPHMEAVVEHLNDQIPDLHIDRLSGYVPIQGEGTYQGERFYFRSRYTHASLAVGSTDDNEVSSWNAARYAEIRVTEPGDEFGAGWLTPEEVKIVFPVLIQNLQPRTQEQNDEAIKEFKESVEKLVEQMNQKRNEQ